MKKIFKILVIAFCVFSFWVLPTFADVNQTFTFLWEQSTDDLANLREWRLYIGFASGGPYTAAKDVNGADIVIPYDSADTDGNYTSAQTMVIPGASGTTVNAYFVLTAVDNEGYQTAYSNQAVDESTGNDYIVIKLPIGRPFSVKVQVQTGN